MPINTAISSKTGKLEICTSNPWTTAKIKYYPDGSSQVMVASKPIFGRGWEDAGQWPAASYTEPDGEPDGEPEGEPEGVDIGRSRRRAKRRVWDIAKSTPSLDYFVTLTLDGRRVDRYDVGQISRRLDSWLRDQVRRRGLAYIIIPEYHKDKAIHYHGLFNAALEMVDSGTVIPPGGGKPRRPRSKAQRAAWLADGGRVVYNLPNWPYGYTTAIQLYGSRDRAINYVAKYITKSDDKIGGRWYRHGGATGEPAEVYLDIPWAERPEGADISIDAAGLAISVSYPAIRYTKEDLINAGLWSSIWDY